MLLIGSGAPLRNAILVKTVLLLELTRGILMDLYWLSRGNYAVTPCMIWIVIHLAIILRGWYLWRQAETETGSEPRTAESF